MKIREFLLESDEKVGKTILKQIKAIDKFALPAWGAKNYVYDKNGIQFDVRGSKFRGRVVIKYDRGKDAYNIEFGQVKNLDWKSKYKAKGIYADNLVQTIDDYVG